MATIKTDLICNLNQPVAATFLHGNLFSQDNAGNTINVHVMDNGEPATIGGAVSANVIRADGNTVAVSGAIDGNKAYVILPQACYAVPGRVEIIIKLTQNTTITTIAAIVANVYRSTTDTVVDPGTIIPSIQTLIAEIEEAVDSIPVDYSGLLHTIAEDYSSSKTYPVVGMYAWQGGVLKRNIVPITTAETYTAAHWTNAVLGDDVSALKSAINEIANIETVYSNNLLNTQNVTTGYYWTDGHHDSTSYSNSGFVPVQPGSTYYLWSDAHSGVFSIRTMRFVTGYDENKNFVSSSNVSDVASYTVPSGVYYIIVSAVPAYLTSHGMITTKGTNAEYSEYFEPYTTYEINMDYVDAYTKDEVDEKIGSIDETISGYKIPELLSELEISPQLNLYDSSKASNGYVTTNGTIGGESAGTYCHSAKISVKEGTKYTFWALYNGAVVSANARFICSYNSSDVAVSSAGSGSGVSSYTVPSGIASMVVSFEQNRRYLFMVVEGETQPTYLLPYQLEHYVAKESFISKAFSSLNRGDFFIKTNTASATANQIYELTEHLDAKKNCAYMFFGKFSLFTSIEIGHGKTETGANYMVIDGTNLVSYKPDGTAYQTTAHGLTITDFIFVSIKVADTQTARATVTIITNGGSTTLTNIIFFGCNGSIYYKCGQATTDVEFVYTLMDLKKDVFIFGDSYTSLADDKRWPHYAIINGDNNMLLSGFAGADADEEYPSFENIVALKNPKYIAWFLGMNNADASGSINVEWVTIVQKVLSYCDANGITPILATIPNTPTQRNVEKNAWVKASGRRYVDFAKAVGAESAGSSWYTGMLSNDNVHPTAEGAKALWLQLRMDLPEIMEGKVN